MSKQVWSGFGRLDGTPAKRIFDAASAVYAAAGGQLLFIRDGRLLAQDFDPVGLELKGEPLTVANGVTAATVISASTVGPIVYRSPSPDRGKRQLVWVDRSGEEMDKVIYADFAHRVLRFWPHESLPEAPSLVAVNHEILLRPKSVAMIVGIMIGPLSPIKDLGCYFVFGFFQVFSRSVTSRFRHVVKVAVSSCCRRKPD